jgi:hypothetical protein
MFFSIVLVILPIFSGQRERSMQDLELPLGLATPLRFAALLPCCKNKLPTRCWSIECCLCCGQIPRILTSDARDCKYLSVGHGNVGVR